FLMGHLTFQAGLAYNSNRTEETEPGKESTQDQCMQCKLFLGCWVCVTTSSGGITCIRDCFSCHVFSHCGTDAPNAASTNEASKRPLHLSAHTIKEIATVHPRFGFALAKLNREGGFGDVSMLYLTPIEIAEADIDMQLKSGDLPVEYLNK